jgi:hypothetical protein
VPALFITLQKRALARPPFVAPAPSRLLRLFLRRLRRRILAGRLLPFLHPLLLLCVALLYLLGLLLMALFDLLPSCIIGILLSQALVVLLLFLLELLMVLCLFGVEPVLLVAVFLVEIGVAGVRRSRPIVRCNFLGVSEGWTIGIAARVWRTIRIVIGTSSIVITAPIGWRLVASAGFPCWNNSRAAK